MRGPGFCFTDLDNPNREDMEMPYDKNHPEWQKPSAKHEPMHDFNGLLLGRGSIGKLSSGYHDSAIPVYLNHAEVEVVRFLRKRVRVQLIDRMYEGHPHEFLSVLPKSIVRTDLDDTPITRADLEGM